MKTNIRRMLRDILKSQSRSNNDILNMQIGTTLYLLEIYDFDLFMDRAHTILIHDIDFLPYPFSVCSEDDDGNLFIGHIEVNSADKELQEKLREVRREVLAGGYSEGGSWWI